MKYKFQKYGLLPKLILIKQGGFIHFAFPTSEFRRSRKQPEGLNVISLLFLKEQQFP